MAEMNFSGSEIARTRRYSVNLSSPGHVDTPFLPDFVLNQVYFTGDGAITPYPTFKYNDSKFKKKGMHYNNSSEARVIIETRAKRELL
jgi:hypothetical protein